MEPQTVFVLGMAVGFLFGGLVCSLITWGILGERYERELEDREQVARSVEKS